MPPRLEEPVSSGAHSHYNKEHILDMNGRQISSLSNGTSHRLKSHPHLKKHSAANERTGNQSNPGCIPKIAPIPGGQKYSMQNLLELGESLKNDRTFVESEKNDLYHTIFPPGTVISNNGYDDNEEILYEMAHGLPKRELRRPINRSMKYDAKYEGSIPSLWNPSTEQSAAFSQTVPANPSAFANSSSVPPGLGPNLGQSAVMYADRIMWMYKDSSGIEQGPFSGIMMHGWYKDNWLPDHLVMRRAEDTEFITLAQFKVAVGNSVSPFMVPLPPVVPPARAPSYETHPMSPTTSVFGPWGQSGLGKWSPLTGTQASSPVTAGQPISAVGTPVRGQSPRISESENSKEAKQEEVRHFFEDSRKLPEEKSVNENKQASQFEKTATDIKILDKEASAAEKIDHFHNGNVRSSAARSIVSPVRSSNRTAVHKQDVRSHDVDSVRSVETENSALASAQTETEKEGSFDVESQGTSASMEPLATSAETKTQKHTPKPLTSVAAPWSKAGSSSTVSQISLTDLQSAKKKKHQEKKQQEKTAALAAAVNADIDLSEFSTEVSVKPSPAPWAFVSPTAPVKPLSEIQKEQLEAKKKATNLKTPDNSILHTPGGKSYASALGKRPVTVPRRNRETAVPAPVPAAIQHKTVEPIAIQQEELSDEWTTVKSSKKAVSPSSNGSDRSTVTPLVRKSASPAKLSGGSADFMHWCRSSVRGLNPGVNQNELLNMLVSLPVTSDSKDIIADIVYSNSSTMDGRRFAEEFLKRRQRIGDSVKNTDFKKASTDRGSEFHVVKRK